MSNLLCMVSYHFNSCVIIYNENIATKMCIFFEYSHCFVSNHQIQSMKSFISNAEINHQGLTYAKVNDDLWSLYIFELVQAGRQTAGWTTKTLVTCVGRQPASSTWVLGPDVQINSSGELIPLEEHQYYWSVLQHGTP